MNAYYLHKPDGTATEWSACGKCGMPAAPGNYDLSVGCCACRECKQPLNDSEIASRLNYHPTCEKEMTTRHEAERLEAAEIVDDYEGPVYLPGVGTGSFGEGYFSDMGELARHLQSRTDIGPFEFAYCCESTVACVLDVDDILESATEGAFEEAKEHLNSVEELERCVEIFNTINGGLLSWDWDPKRKIRIPAETTND